jgi:pectate lyase
MNGQHRSLTSIWMPIQTSIVVVALLFTISLHAAFEGFGSSTPGGNNAGTTVVTSLADAGPGTLRDALVKGNNQRIVFTVGGTINLKSRLELRGRGFITVDGSTAASPGITLQGNGFYIRNSHDIVITHIRIRDSVSDGITLWDNSYNVVFDHLSVTNSADGNIDITEDTRNVTVSWCIIGDTRSNSFALKSKGMLLASFEKLPVTGVSLHHNLFINRFQRSPQISTAGLFDIRNNVIRDWGAYGIRIRAGAQGNIVNNVFRTKNNELKAVILESDAGPVHIAGNQGPSSANVNALSTKASPFAVAPVKTDPVLEVERKVLVGAGAFPRDHTDTLLAGTPIQARAPIAYADPDPLVSEKSIVYPAPR